MSSSSIPAIEQTIRPPMPAELVALETEAAARIEALEAAALLAEGEACRRDREQLHAAVHEVLASAGLSCLWPFIELPDPTEEVDVQVHICLPRHWPITIRFVRDREGLWTGQFQDGQVDDPLAPPDSTRPLWRIVRPSHFAYAVHFGTALYRARRADDDDDNIPV